MVGHQNLITPSTLDHSQASGIGNHLAGCHPRDGRGRGLATAERLERNADEPLRFYAPVFQAIHGNPVPSVTHPGPHRVSARRYRSVELFPVTTEGQAQKVSLAALHLETW